MSTTIYLEKFGPIISDKRIGEEIFSFRRIRLAPAVVLLGFGITIYSILKNPKNT